MSQVQLRVFPEGRLPENSRCLFVQCCWLDPGNPIVMNSLTQIERALQSQSLGDHLSIISQCARAIRENPFPLFVNALLVRLADTFNGEKLVKVDHGLNLIRLRIVKLLKECGMDLAVVGHNEEMVRRVMKVSHSNDYKSRALTMLFFAAAAPIVHRNKKVQHLLVEGLDCTDVTELSAAIVSTGHMGKFSAEFSSLIVDKISELVCGTQADEDAKVRLMDDLSFFKENISITKKCMDLGRYVLRNNPDEKVSLVGLNALTELAKRNGLVVNGQIELLLSEIENFLYAHRFLRSFLYNLRQLADSPQHWDQRSVKKLQSILPTLLRANYSDCLVLWLECMTSLASFIHADIVADYPNVSVRIKTATLLIQLQQVKSDNLKEAESLLGLALLSLLSDIVNTDLCISAAERSQFYKLIVSQMCNDNLNNLGIEDTCIIETLKSTNPDKSRIAYCQALETLNAIADFQLGAASSLNQWALEMIKSVPPNEWCRVPDPLFTLALLPIKINQQDTAVSDFTESIVQQIREDISLSWLGYKIARTGFRFGHWSDVSLPILEVIQERCSTVECSTFMSALVHIAGAQVPHPVSVQALKNARQSLRHALLVLTPLTTNSRNSHCFTFPVAFCNVLGQLFGAINTVLVTFNCNIESEPLMFGLHHMDYMMLSLSQARNEFDEVRKAWLRLLECSFDADSNTKDQLELLARHSDICKKLLECVAATDVINIPPYHSVSKNCTNRQLEMLVDWARSQANDAFKPVSGSAQERISAWSNNIMSFTTLFSHLATLPLYLPRYFFQQIWRTTLKLNVLPQPREHEQFIQIQHRQLPVMVEGVIESNNPNRICSVEINVFKRVDKSTEITLVDSRKSSIPVGDSYFKEQFLVTVKKLTEIVVKIYLISDDSDCRCKWIADPTGRLTVNVPEQRAISLTFIHHKEGWSLMGEVWLVANVSYRQPVTFDVESPDDDVSKYTNLVYSSFQDVGPSIFLGFGISVIVVTQFLLWRLSLQGCLDGWLSGRKCFHKSTIGLYDNRVMLIGNINRKADIIRSPDTSDVE